MERLRKTEQALIEGYKRGGKLLRDGIMSNSLWCLEWFRTLPSKQFQIAVGNKLVEEAREGRRVIRAAVNSPEDGKGRVLEEFADQLTLMGSYLDHMGWEWHELMAVKNEKDERMGKFSLRKFGRSVRREQK